MRAVGGGDGEEGGGNRGEGKGYKGEQTLTLNRSFCCLI